MTRRGWFLGGLFLTTVSALVIEILDTRLLSVVTWYHLSFFAVSIAMFGMAAGGVRVYLGEDEFGGEAAPDRLAHYAVLFAVSIPVSHIANLVIPIPIASSLTNVAAIAFATLALAVPFYLAGIVVAIALTRIPGPSGLIYAIDLLGAAIGALLVVPLLDNTNLSSAALLCAAVATLGAFCFIRFAGDGGELRALALALLLVIFAVWNVDNPRGLHVAYSKGVYRDRSAIEHEFWTIHGEVIAMAGRQQQRPFYWGAGMGAAQQAANTRAMLIDGAAASVMTEWDGDPAALDWVKYDVTSLPYHLRKGGEVAVIGSGAGRDLLTALWGRADRVTGIEVNSAFVELLTDTYRDYANIADDPRVRLVHDEGRSYLTRTRERFDILQMSLIDTWAATGAGAFTLSENGLYTLEAWRTFLDVLKPGGVFSVSRWYSEEASSETSRLISLATAALLDRGIERPDLHMIVAARNRVATLLVSTLPFGRPDLTAARRASESYGFQLLLAPQLESPHALLAEIGSSSSIDELEARVADQPYDYSVPTDERPYFFNILKPSAVLSAELTWDHGVVAHGNLLATSTLILLWTIALLLVLATIFAPLARSGLPNMELPAFLGAAAYFALIGMGYMFIQIPLMQRLSVYLGHPTYAIAGVLFSMILATGLGSLLSDRLRFEEQRRWPLFVPIAIAALLTAATLALQPIIEASIQRSLAVRFAVVVGLVGAIAFPLGLCFPLGLRLVRRISGDATPWMWGINGAAGVLASVTAVAVSLWSGISTSLYLGTSAYLLLTLPATLLWARKRDQAPGG